VINCLLERQLFVALIPLHGTWTGFPSDNLGMSVEVNVIARRAGSDGFRADMERRGTEWSFPA
jgi:hypothetical protein